MSFRFVIRLAITALGLLPGSAIAQGLPNRSITISNGINTPTFVGILTNLLTFLAASIVSIAVVLFLIGATYMVGSRGKPDFVEKGKKLMTNSLIGMAVVLGAYTILRTAFFLLFI